jgi:hypothetical protein
VLTARSLLCAQRLGDAQALLQALPVAGPLGSFAGLLVEALGGPMPYAVVELLRSKYAAAYSADALIGQVRRRPAACAGG